jgi:hypothetical protein
MIGNLYELSGLNAVFITSTDEFSMDTPNALTYTTNHHNKSTAGRYNGHMMLTLTQNHITITITPIIFLIMVINDDNNETECKITVI